MMELVKSRMETLGMPTEDYSRRFRGIESEKSWNFLGEETTSTKPKTLSYVIINPPRELELSAGDVV